MWEASFVLAEWISHLKGLACCQAFQAGVCEGWGRPACVTTTQIPKWPQSTRWTFSAPGAQELVKEAGEPSLMKRHAWVEDFSKKTTMQRVRGGRGQAQNWENP